MGKFVNELLTSYCWQMLPFACPLAFLVKSRQKTFVLMENFVDALSTSYCRGGVSPPPANFKIDLLKPPFLCKGGGFERQREDGGIFIVNAMYRRM